MNPRPVFSSIKMGFINWESYFKLCEVLKRVELEDACEMRGNLRVELILVNYVSPGEGVLPCCSHYHSGSLSQAFLRAKKLDVSRIKEGEIITQPIEKIIITFDLLEQYLREVESVTERFPIFQNAPKLVIDDIESVQLEDLANLRSRRSELFPEAKKITYKFDQIKVGIIPLKVQISASFQNSYEILI